MNEVKRWYCQIYGGVCEAHSGSEVIDLDEIDVDFVKASDYDAMQSELAALRETLKFLRDTLDGEFGKEYEIMRINSVLDDEGQETPASGTGGLFIPPEEIEKNIFTPGSVIGKVPDNSSEYLWADEEGRVPGAAAGKPRIFTRIRHALIKFIAGDLPILMNLEIGPTPRQGEHQLVHIECSRGLFVNPVFRVVKDYDLIVRGVAP